MPVKAQSLLTLTKDEQEYINCRGTIKAVSIDGAAPLQYYDANGQIKGISKETLETISNMTGLIFTYQLYNTVDEIINSDADIVFGISDNYSPENMVLSTPFLISETILFMNSSINPHDLDNKKYAAVSGNILPERIKEENTIYFSSREACMNAVDSGKADYGYGNAYSVAFYTIQNNYRNIITVPKKKKQESIV